LRKVEDVTTISKSQSLTSVSIKDCTLRVPNETTTLFLLRVTIKAIFIQVHIYVFVSRVYQGYAKYAKTRTFFPVVERKIRGNCSLYCLRYAVHVHHFITDPPIPTPRNYTTICLGL